MGRMAMIEGRLTARQIEATRRAIRHCLSRQGKRWIPVFPHRPVTRKPREVRMGGGAGSVKFWATMVKPGTIRFEVAGVDERTSIKALESGATKLPFPVRVIRRPPCRY
jgi:large subunit ribosomal protein L16